MQKIKLAAIAQYAIITNQHTGGWVYIWKRFHWPTSDYMSYPSLPSLNFKLIPSLIIKNSPKQPHILKVPQSALSPNFTSQISKTPTICYFHNSISNFTELLPNYHLPAPHYATFRHSILGTKFGKFKNIRTSISDNNFQIFFANTINFWKCHNMLLWQFKKIKTEHTH